MMLTARRVLVFWTAVSVFGMQAAIGFAQTSGDPSLADALTKLDADAKDAMAKTKVPEFPSPWSTRTKWSF
jgi:hypothetical protein